MRGVCIKEENVDATLRCGTMVWIMGNDDEIAMRKKVWAGAKGRTARYAGREGVVEAR